MMKVLPFLLLGVLACESDSTGPPAETDARAFAVTDLAEYVLPADVRERMAIGFVYSNRTHDTVWMIGCRSPGTELQKLVDGEWVGALGGPSLGCLSAYPIEAGAQLRGELRIASDRISVEPIEGTYRLIWREIVWNFETRTSTSVFGDLLPMEWRISNRFEIRE